MTYVVLNGFTVLLKFVSRGKIVPADYDQREYWTCKFYPVIAISPTMVAFSKVTGMASLRLS